MIFTNLHLLIFVSLYYGVYSLGTADESITSGISTSSAGGAENIHEHDDAVRRDNKNDIDDIEITARYDNYKVYQVIPNNQEQINILQLIETSSDSYKFLVGPAKLKMDVVLIVAPHKFAEFATILRKHNFLYKLLDTNLQEKIDAENAFRLRATTTFGWHSYYPLEIIYKWMDTMVKKYPNNLELIIAGRSYEGREIRGIKLSFNNNPDNVAILLEGGMHAREWISPATVTFMLNELIEQLNSPSIDNNITSFIRTNSENINWYFFPIINPDGYAYTFKHDRLWRKTRTPSSYYICYGVDPNRNWDFHWNEIGSSKYPCAETYAGRRAFSEPEIYSYSQYLTTIRKQLKLYFAFHSYSQILLFPYGHTAVHTENHDDLLAIGRKGIEALAKRYGTRYSIGNTYAAIYPATGSSMDWVYGNLSIPLSYTFELRPGGNRYSSGFELPPDQILPTAEETYDAVMAIAHEANNLGYI